MNWIALKKKDTVTLSGKRLEFDWVGEELKAIKIFGSGNYEGILIRPNKWGDSLEIAELAKPRVVEKWRVTGSNLIAKHDVLFDEEEAAMVFAETLDKSEIKKEQVEVWE